MKIRDLVTSNLEHIFFPQPKVALNKELVYTTKERCGITIVFGHLWMFPLYIFFSQSNNDLRDLTFPLCLKKQRLEFGSSLYKWSKLDGKA